MSYSLIWLPDVLLKAGLKVSRVEGWENRGRREMGEVRGVICHHTATPGHLDKVMPTLGLLINGRAATPKAKALPGPLCQLGLGRDGTFFVVAAGLANHAGEGEWKGQTNGNANFIGIEAENSGLPGDAWPDVQMDAYRRGVAAILKHVHAGPGMCCGHKEYAPKRKPDPSFDMFGFRAAVAALMAGEAVAPPLIPAQDAKARPTLRRGDRNDQVKALQTELGKAGFKVAVDGDFGAGTEAAIRNVQRKAGLTPDGIVGPKTWAELDKA